MQTQTEATVSPKGKIKIRKTEQEIPVMIESDWYESKMYQMVLEMMDLPDKNRLRKSRKLEK